MRIRNLFLYRRYSILTFIILLLIFALILTSLRVRQKKGVDFLDALLMEICSPFQRASTLAIKTIQGIFQHYIFLVGLQRENLTLRQKVAELERENNLLREEVLASRRLQLLLQFRDKHFPSSITAQVIGKDPSSWFKSITLNRGEKDGVKKGMAVITPQGVIGQILKTSPNYSTVLLITDYNSAIDAITQRTRAKAIVEGLGENLCQLKYLRRSEEVMVGDKVVTSGLTGSFPKGLMIGEIRKVEKTGEGVFQYAELIPSVDLTKLEEVLIITEFPSPPQGEEERKNKKVKGATRKGR